MANLMSDEAIELFEIWAYGFVADHHFAGKSVSGPRQRKPGLFSADHRRGRQGAGYWFPIIQGTFAKKPRRGG